MTTGPGWPAPFTSYVTERPPWSCQSSTASDAPNLRGASRLSGSADGCRQSPAVVIAERLNRARR